MAAVAVVAAVAATLALFTAALTFGMVCMLLVLMVLFRPTRRVHAQTPAAYPATYGPPRCNQQRRRL
jgi:hypothetical protein